MGGLLKSKPAIAAAIVAALVGLYALLGFKVAPGFVRNKAVEYARSEYGRELSLGEIRIHPFKLQFEARDIAFPDADGERMLGLDRLFADFEPSSLWKRAFYFSEVDVESPYVRALIRPDGAMNLADLAPHTSPEEGEDAAPPKVWIADLAVTDGVVDFLDRARSRPFDRKFAPVAFTLQDFKTTPEGGDFRLSARSQAQEQFDWKGHFALAPIVSSEGEFTIADLRAAGVGEFLGDALNYNLTDGSIDLGGRYRLALGSTTELDLTLPTVEIDELALRARGVNEDWIKIPKVVVAETAIAIPAQTVGIGRVAVTGLSAQIWMDKDGTINLERLFTGFTQEEDAGAPDQEAVSTAPTATNPPQPASSAENDWTVKLAVVELENASIQLEDRSITPAAKFELAPVQVKITDLSLDQTRPMPVSLSAKLDDTTSIKAEGTLTPEPFAAELDVQLDELDLRKFQPYVGQATAMTIRRGQTRATGKFSLSPPSGKKP